MSGVAEVSPKYLTEAALNAIPVGYKQTEVGVIPEDWELKCLGEICNFENGDRSSNYPSAHEFSNSGIPFINAGHVSEGSIDLEDMDYIPTHVYERLGGGKVKSGDLVYCLRGSLGKFGVVSDEFGLGAVASSLVIVRPKKSTTTNFVSAYFKSNLSKNMISLWAGGAAQPNLGAKELANFLVPLPNFEEQTAIANALSDVDALISELEKLIAKKQAIKTAAMQQLLTGRTRLPQFALREDGTPKGYKPSELGEIPEDWEVVTLGTASSFINGRAYSLHEWENSGTPVIRLQNLTGRGDEYYYSNLQLPEKQYCKYGDLLFMWSATFGPVIWRGPRAIYHYHIWKIACEVGYSQSYLFYLLDDMTEKLKRSSSSGGTMLHVTKEKMESTKAAFPSYEEQTAIATILSDMDADIQALEQRLGKTRQIKQGMMQELLTGKTRLFNYKEV